MPCIGSYVAVAAVQRGALFCGEVGCAVQDSLRVEGRLTGCAIDTWESSVRLVTISI